MCLLCVFIPVCVTYVCCLCVLPVCVTCVCYLCLCVTTRVHSDICDSNIHHFCCCCEPCVAENKTVVELLAMPRPFPKLKALDMDKVGADVVKAL
jgi:hypothetical protein